MKYFFSVLALAAAGLAQDLLAFTTLPSSVEVGEPVTLTWTGGDGDAPITITLRRGSSDDLQTIEVLTGNASGNSFTWTPSPDLEDGEDYALEISQGVDESNYTGLFSISGGQPDGSSSDSSSSSSATATSETTMTSANSTSTRSNTITMTGTAPMSSGTGMTMSRNTTLSMPSPTRSSTGGGINAPSPTEEAPEPSDTADSSDDSAASRLGAQVGVGIAAVMGLAAFL